MPAKRKVAKTAQTLAKNTVLPASSLPLSVAAAGVTAAFPHSSNVSLAGPKYIVGLVDVNSSAHRAYQQWYSLTEKMGIKINLENYLRKQSNYVLNVAMTAVPPALGAEFSSFERRAIACFDAGCGGREVLMPQYKATRARERPAELLQTFDAFRDAIAALGDKVLTLPTGAEAPPTNAEADDMIATAAAVCKARGNPSVIITSDRDMLQLVDDATMCVLYDTLKKEYFDEAAAQRRMGVMPRDLLAYKVLAGDDSDNIAGCVGVGKTRAMKLVNKYRTLDRIIAEGQHDVSFPPKMRAALKDFGPSVALHSQVMGLQEREELRGAITAFLEK